MSFGAATERSRIALIVVGSALACLLLYYVEQVLGVNYLVKTVVKIVLFVGLPWYYRYITRGCQQAEMSSGYAQRALEGGRSVNAGFLLGTGAFLIIFLAYFLFKDALDLPAIARELQEKSKITPANFLLVGLYVTFGNSFLEEWFFRGFVFLSLYRMGKKALAYCYSSLLFGLYHFAIFQTWFDPWLIGLALFGLITVGFIFDWLDAWGGFFYNSWLTHILADAAIILIGMRMFAII